MPVLRQQQVVARGAGRDPYPGLIMWQSTTDTGAWTPLRIVLLYALFGLLWILFSDTIVFWFTTDQATLSHLQTYKGWVFILATAALLFGLISRMADHRQKILDELRQAEDYSRTLFDLAPMGLVLCAMDGRLLDINPAYAAIIGRTVAETMRLPLWDITPKKYAPLEEAQLAALRTTGWCGPYEKEYIHQDGHLVPVRLRGRIITRAGVPCIWSSVEDVSAYRQAEEELRRYRDQLEELVRERTLDLDKSKGALQNLLADMYETKKHLEAANAKLLELDRLKSMFIASMSHELRTPLNSIIGFTGLLLQGLAGEINDEQRDQLTRVYRAGKYLLALITDVIDIAKIESGKIHAVVEEFPLAAVIDEACESLKVQMAEKGLALIKVLPATPIQMKSDRRRLLQCLLNFLSNAVKFSEQGTLRVEAKVLEAKVRSTSKREMGQAWVEIAVSDTGVGIKQEDMVKLFHSFVRLKSSRKIIVPGTGLGLYLTKKLATEVLGGDVAAESREGKGSTFRLQVPVCLEMERK